MLPFPKPEFPSKRTIDSFKTNRLLDKLVELHKKFPWKDWVQCYLKTWTRLILFLHKWWLTRVVLASLSSQTYFDLQLFVKILSNRTCESYYTVILLRF